jgi:hypothetical protein
VTLTTRLAVNLAGFVLVSGCGAPKPCLELHQGDRLKIVVVLPDRKEGSECAAGLGIVPGTELTATIRSIAGGGDNQDCVAAEADFVAPDGWTWTYRHTSTDDADISGWYDAAKDNCAGVLSVGIQAPSIPSPDWDPATMAGAAPATIELGYSERDDRSDPSCPGQCGVRFGVKVSRL